VAETPLGAAVCLCPDPRVVVWPFKHQQQLPAAVMASSTILSPRPLDLAPAASLSELDQFCSGPLDSFLEEAARTARSRGHSSSKAASSHKKAASGSGKLDKAGAVKKAQVRHGCRPAHACATAPAVLLPAHFHIRAMNRVIQRL